MPHRRNRHRAHPCLRRCCLFKHAHSVCWPSAVSAKASDLRPAPQPESPPTDSLANKVSRRRLAASLRTFLSALASCRFAPPTPVARRSTPRAKFFRRVAHPMSRPLTVRRGVRFERPAAPPENVGCVSRPMRPPPTKRHRSPIHIAGRRAQQSPPSPTESPTSGQLPPPASELRFAQCLDAPPLAGLATATFYSEDSPRLEGRHPRNDTAGYPRHLRPRCG